jgi:hypothetical protein
MCNPMVYPYLAFSIFIYTTGGLDHFLFFHILGIMIPADFHIFQRGWNHQPDNIPFTLSLYWRRSPHDLPGFLHHFTLATGNLYRTLAAGHSTGAGAQLEQGKMGGVTWGYPIVYVYVYIFIIRYCIYIYLFIYVFICLFILNTCCYMYNILYYKLYIY